MNKTRKRIFIFSLLCIFIMTAFTACGKSGVKVSSDDALVRKLTSRSAVKINVSEDIVLEEPVVITGNKEIVGEGKIVASLENSEESYMFTVANGGSLTIGGSVEIDAASLAGVVYVQEGGQAFVQDKAVVANAAEAAATVLNEGTFEVKGGSLKDAKGHNVINKNAATVSGGEIIGSGSKYAGIWNEGTLVQSGGKVSAAYNNISNLKGSSFTFEGGSNEESIRDGVFVAEGATMKATNKDATIVNAGARGILLQGEADIKVITVKECADTLIKVAKTGVLNLGNGILQEGNYHGIDNAGTVNMLGGNILKNANCGIVNTGTLKVTSGNIAENANKGILNKHEGKADVTSAMVTLTSNKIAIANEDKAVFEFAKAKILMSTQTNIYCFDGTMNIHDASLNASTSNNVRIVDGVINMKDVEVKGNSQKSGTSHHGIYMEGGLIEAENVTVSMTTGNGIRNKGGVFKGKNIIMHDINRIAVSQAKHDYLDVEGLTEIEGLEIQSTNYSNVWNDGGGTIKIKDGKLAVAASNSIRSNDGKMELDNVLIPGHKEGSKNNIHGIYLEGGEIVAKNVTIKDTSGNALRNKNGKFVGTNIKMTNIKGDTAISNLPLNDEEKDGIIEIDKLTLNGAAGKNITLDSGVTTIKNATLGKAGANNVKLQNNAATLNLYNVKIEGQTKNAIKDTHGIMVEGGNVYGEKVQIVDTKACGIRCKMGVVDLKDVVMKNLGQAGISGSKMTKAGKELGVGSITIDGIELTKAGTNNVLVDAGKVTVKNGTLGKVETNNHNAKVSGTGVLVMDNVKVEGTSNDSKYGIIAEGGEAILTDVTIKDLAKSALHANKETSKITGKNITVKDGVYAITGSNGTITIDGLKTSKIEVNNVLANNKLQVTLTNSSLSKTDGHNVKVTDDALVKLDTVEIKGVTADDKYGIIAEGGDAVLKNVKIYDVAKSGIHANKASSEVTGENVLVEGGNYAITGSNGTITIDGLKTSKIVTNNVLADSKLQVTLSNSSLGETEGHNVKATGDALVSLTKTELLGVSGKDRHGVMAEGGDIELKDVTISNVKGVGIRINKASSSVTGENVTIKDSAYGITGNNGKVVVKGLETAGITNNNLLLEEKAEFVISESTLCKVSGDAHNVKVAGNANLKMTDTAVQGTTSDKKYGIIAEGGDVVLEKVEISNLASSGIHVTEETSAVTGKYVTIKDGVSGITGDSGTVEIEKLKTSNLSANNITTSGTCLVAITKSTGGYGLGVSGGHSIKVVDDAIVDLDTVEIKGVTAKDRHGIMAEGGDVVLHNVSIHDVANSAIRINKPTSEVTGEKVVIKDSNNAINGSDGKVTIDNLTTSGISNNNVLASYDENLAGCVITITNSKLGWTAGHNIKTELNGKVYLQDTSINGVSTSSKYGVMAEGGYANLDNVEIKAVSAAAIRSNKDTSVVEGKDVTILKSGQGVSASYGLVTIENLESSATTTNVTISDNANVVIKNGTLNQSAGSNTVVSGGTLTFEDVTVNGTTGTKETYGIHVSKGTLDLKGDILLQDAKAEGIYNSGGTIKNTDADKITIQNTATAISGSAGTTELNNVTTTGKQTCNVMSSGTAKITITKGTLGKTTGSNVFVKEGTVVLDDVSVNGSNTHGIELTGGTLTQKGDLVVQETGARGIYNHGGTINHKTAEDTVLLKNIGDLAILNEANSSISLANVTTENVKNGHSIKNDGANSIVEINGGTFATTKTNNVSVPNGTVKLTGVTVNGTTSQHGILASGGNVELNTVTINGANGAGIRVNNASSEVKGNVVTITGGTSGVSASAGKVNITGLNASATNTNVIAEGAEVTLIGGTFNKTSASNVTTTKGILTLNGGNVNGSSEACGIEVSGGTLNIQGNVTVSDTKLQGIYNHGGTIDGLTATSLTIQNTGNTAIWNATDTETNKVSSTILKNVNISGVKDRNNVLNEGEGSTITIDGGEFMISPTNNVLSAGGTITLKNLTVNGTKNESHSVLAQGGDIILSAVTLQNSKVAGIRVNRETSTVTGTNVTILNSVTGVSASAGEVSITGLNASATSTNVLAEGANVTLVNGTFAKTTGPNISVTAGRLVLDGGSVNGSNTHGIELKGGTLTQKGDLVVQETGKRGIYNHGGTINNADTEDTLLLKNIGDTAILNEGSSITLQNVTIENVKVGHSIKNDGANSIVEINGGTFAKTPTNNVSVANGTVKLIGVTVNGTTSQHGILASNGDVELDTVTINGANGAGIRVNNANSEVIGTNVIITGSTRAISSSAGSVSITGLTSTVTAESIHGEGGTISIVDATVTGGTRAVSNTSNSGSISLEDFTATGQSEYSVYNKGTLNIAGEINASIYNDAAVIVNATKPLTGSSIELDYAKNADNSLKLPANLVAIQFAIAPTAAQIAEMQNSITLGTNVGAEYSKYFSQNQMTLISKTNPEFTVANYSDLTTLMSNINAQNIAKATIKIAGDIDVTSTITIPAGKDITLIDDGNVRTIKRTTSIANKHVIDVQSGATLTVSSTSDNTTPKLIVDGGSKEASPVVTIGYVSLINSNGTLNVESGVELTNVASKNSSADAEKGCGYAIRVAAGTTTFKGKITSIEGKNTNDFGNAIRLDNATLTIENAIVENNESKGFGTIYVSAGGSATVSNSSFKNNSTNTNGGVFHVTGNAGNKLLVNDCTFESNSSKYGGVLINSCGTGDNIKFTNCAFISNEATTHGGAIYNEGAITVNGCTFTQNKAPNNNNGTQGGAIFMKAGTLNVDVNQTTVTTFSNNEAHYGGAISQEAGVITLNGTKFNSNHATWHGGAIYHKQSANLSNCEFSLNIADCRGGAVCNETGTLTAVSCTFSDNKAKNIEDDNTYSSKADRGEGGAYRQAGGGTGEFTNCNFNNNVAEFAGGGAIKFNSGTLDIDGCTFTGNTATLGETKGHDIFAAVKPTIKNSTFNPLNVRATNGNSNYYTDDGGNNQ